MVTNGSSQHVLVTGATGFIGRHLVAQLVRRGTRVTCFTRSSSRTEHLTALGCDIVRGDLTDIADMKKAVADVDAVFHLAGLTHALRTEELGKVNGTGCRVLADACGSRSNPPVLVYVSSLSASGPSGLHTPPVSETMPPRPISRYGQSKRLGEIEIQRRAGDIPCTVVRPGVVFGPYDPATVSIIDPIFHFRVHLVVGVFRSPALSLIYVDDLVKMLLQAAESGQRLQGDREGVYSAPGYYFACDDSEYPTYWEFGKRLANALDRRALVWPVCRSVGQMIGGGAELINRMRGRSSLLNLDKIREGTAPGWACSAAKARRELGFAPAQDLDTALGKTASWYLRSIQSPRVRAISISS